MLRLYRTMYKLRLQIFLGPLLNSIQRLIYVLDRVGHAEPQITFAELAKGGAGKAGHACIFQQRVGQLLRGPSRTGDVGESVKRALGQPAGESLDLVDALNKSIAPTAELFPHFV